MRRMKKLFIQCLLIPCRKGIYGVPNEIDSRQCLIVRILSMEISDNITPPIAEGQAIVAKHLGD